MGGWDVIFIGIGLAMDAFAVAICECLANKKISFQKRLEIACFFALFQFLMPLIGFNLGNTFEKFVVKIDHWLSFFLLTIIGINMIKSINEEENYSSHLSLFYLFYLAIATSIDALAIGVTLAFFDVKIWVVSLTIGVITFILSFIGTCIGQKFGSYFEKNSRIFGGIVLIIIGLKILFEHLHLV